MSPDHVLTNNTYGLLCMVCMYVCTLRAVHVGTLPGSIGSITTMKTMSFNVNNFGGQFPKAFCETKAADCRIGADAGPKWLAGYQAIYPWTLAMNASGNRYECGSPVPSCIVSGGVCNHTSAPHPGQEVTGSPVECV
jgi:hypothetical protein